MAEFLYNFRVEIDGEDHQGAVDIEYDLYGGSAYTFGDISAITLGNASASSIESALRAQCHGDIEHEIKEDYERRSEKYWCARWAGEVA